MSDDPGAPWWRLVWPNWYEPVAHIVSGAMAGGIGVGVGVLVGGFAVWPIAVLAEALTHNYLGPVGVVVLVIVVMVVAGPVAAWLNIVLRRLLRSTTPSAPRQSSLVWAIGIVITAFVVVEVSPFVKDNLLIDGACAAAGGGCIGLVDAMLLHRRTRKERQNRRDFLSRYR